MVKPSTGRAAELAHMTGPLAVGIPEACKLTRLSRLRLYGEMRDGRLVTRSVFTLDLTKLEKVFAIAADLGVVVTAIVEVGRFFGFGVC